MLPLLETHTRRWSGIPQPTFFLAILVSLLGLLTGCVDPYTPDVISNPQSYLVVEGFINLNGVTTIRLSRTRSLSSGAASPAETRATAAIQDEAGTRYALTEQAAGTYTSPALSLGTAHQYQLRLRTAAGREYASDLVTGKLTPAIDSVSWQVESGAVQVYVDSHDATNATRYYRWSYQETWLFHAAYRSELEYVNGHIQPRTENIYWCWQTNTASPILSSTTNRLSQDVVSRFPVTRLPVISAKLGTQYSILVQQYAQTPEEFAYWEQLRKNTENLGTLFDPLPSQLSGNVHSLSASDEVVLGYVGATSVAERRIFIEHDQLPPNTRNETGYETCPTPAFVGLLATPYPFNSRFIPLYEVYAASSSIVIGYDGTGANCADCRLRGTNVKPDFWP